MVLPYLGSVFFTSACLVPCIFAPAVVTQMWMGKSKILKTFPETQHGKFWPLLLTGIILPSCTQVIVLIVGALIMEALEQTNEENGHPDFVRCMDAGFTRDECRNWMPSALAVEMGWQSNTTLHAALGDPVGFPWRNWDIFGAFFYCFTIVTTIGYGTFGPATQGGKAFTCALLLFGIPWNVLTYANLGRTLVELVFGPIQPMTKRYIQKNMGSFASIDTDNSNSLSVAEVVAAFKRAGWLVAGGDGECIRTCVEQFDKDGEAGLSKEEFELFVEHCAEIASAKLETAGAFFLFVVSIVVIGVVTPLTEAENGWAGIDGIYFALITFSTVGLGDLTLSWASARSLHEYFGFWVFVFYSVELALLGACIGSAYDLYEATHILVRPNRLRAQLMGAARGGKVAKEAESASPAEPQMVVTSLS